MGFPVHGVNGAAVDKETLPSSQSGQFGFYSIDGDYALCVNGFWRQNLPEENCKRVAREVIGSETGESRLPTSICSNSRMKRWRGLHQRSKDSSEREREEWTWAVWGVVEVRREGSFCLSMHQSPMDRTLLPTHSTGSNCRRQNWEGWGRFCIPCIAWCSASSIYQAVHEKQSFSPQCLQSHRFKTLVFDWMFVSP